MTHFACSECGAPVSLSNGVLSRTCSHETASIIANLKATAYGSASLANNPPNRVEKAVSRILEVLNIRRV